MKKVFWAILSIVVIVLAVSALGNNRSTSLGTIKIGGALTLTGDVAVYGEGTREGAQMAVDEINDFGGINGQKVEFLVEDTKSTSKDSVTAFTKLRSIDRVKHFMVGFLDNYPGVESLVGKDEIVMSVEASIEVVNGEVFHENVFTTWYRAQPKSELAVQHMAQIGKKRLYLAVGNDGYYATVADFMKEAAKKYGIEVVGADLLGPETDMKTILPRIKSSKADALFFGILDNGVYASFLKNKHGFLKDVAVYTDEVATSYLGPEYAESMEGVRFYNIIPPNQGFLERFKAKYKREPGITASVAYDTLNIIADVIKNKPSDIGKYVRSKTFDTASFGPVTFDQLGGIQTDKKYFLMQQIIDGKAVNI